MRCPFLREAQVASCQSSPFRKQIVRTGGAGSDRCTSPGWETCPAARELHEDHPSVGHCPFLSESLVQYCAAAPMTKFIPYSEQAFSRCGSESHRYCELYLVLAGTATPTNRPAAAGVEAQVDVDGIPVPGWLWFAPNHTWLDLAEDGTCHVGIDALLARTLGTVERVQYLTTKSVERPAAVLTAHGIEATVIFPNPVVLTGPNAAMRVSPERLTRDPYGVGWLFEGQARERNGVSPTAGLLRGADAIAWMRSEIVRLRGLAEEAASEGGTLAADGGVLADGLLGQLPHEEGIRLLHRFLSPAPTDVR